MCYNLLHGCCHEAERAERVAGGLDMLRQHIPLEMRALLLSLTNQISSTAHNLWNIVDYSQVHMSRVPLVLDHFHVLLPCLARTLEDIEAYYANPVESRQRRWRRMYHEMGEELRGTPLAARFVLYNEYINQLCLLLNGYVPTEIISQ